MTQTTQIHNPTLTWAKLGAFIAHMSSQQIREPVKVSAFGEVMGISAVMELIEDTEDLLKGETFLVAKD